MALSCCPPMTRLEAHVICSESGSDVSSNNQDRGRVRCTGSVEAIEKNSQWGERLLTRTKVGAEDWPGELHLINDQHIILKNQLRRRGPHNHRVAAHGVIDEKDYVISAAEVMNRFVWSKLDKIGEGSGPYPSVLDAFASLYGDQGDPVLAAWRALDEALSTLSNAQDVLARSETELSIEERMEVRHEDKVVALEAKIDITEERIEGLEDDVEEREEALIDLLERLEDIEIDSGRHALVADLLEALSFLQALHAANVAATVRVHVQVPRSMSDVMEELQHAGTRMVYEIAPDQAAEALKALTLEVTLSDAGELVLNLEGTSPGMESAEVQSTLTERLDDVLKRGFSLPAFIGSLGTLSHSREHVIDAMIEALEESSDLEVPELEAID